ncbi:MAG: hypothetical protein AAFV80_04475 [Bacteroidota bacterium]
MRSVLVLLCCLRSLSGWACSCAPAPMLSAVDVLEADLVFIGQIVDLELTSNRKVARFRITEHLVSAKRQKEIQIETALSSAACGLSFQEDAYWYIWASKTEAGHFVSNICSRSAPLRDPKSIPTNSRVGSELAFFTSRKKVRGTSTVHFPESRYNLHSGGKASGKFCKGLPKGIWNYYNSKGILTQTCFFNRKRNERNCSTVEINQ